MIDATHYSSLGEMLRDAFVQFKTNTALVELDRKRENARLTYLDVKHAANAVATRLQAAGIGAGDRVAIVMTNQSRYLIGAYAAFHCGAIVVPIDYKLTAKEREALLAHAKPKAVLIEYPLFRQQETFPPALVIVSEAPASADLGKAERWEALTPTATEPTFVARLREDPATIVYSSGTGGRPKGCILPHSAYLSQYTALTELFPMQSGDRYFSILPTNHAIDFMCGFIGPFGGGATVVHQRTLRPEFIFDTLKAERITHMALVPMILTAFERAIREKLAALPPYKKQLIEALMNVNEALTRKKPQRMISRTLLKPIHEAFGGELRMLFCGGAFVDRERAEFFYKLGIPVVIGYGLTEACTVATVNDLRPFRGDSVGKPVRGMEVRVENADASGVGEVVLRGPTLMTGYLDDAELTAETIRDDGFLKTGDLGWMDAANHLHLVGRAKNMIVTDGGKNIYPEDIEGAFADVACDELAVFAANYIWKKRELTGEQLLAVMRVAKNDDSEKKMAGALKDLRERNLRLPDFKRVSGVLMWDDAFPRTASMKLKREELALELSKKATAASVSPL